MRCTDCNQPVHPVVGLDIDGTMGDYHGHFIRFALTYLGWRDNVWQERLMNEPYDGSMSLAEYLAIDKQLYRQIKLAYRQGGMKRSMPVYPDAAFLATWLRNAGVEVWVTTTRPYMRLDNVDPDTRHWLDINHIKFDGLIYDEDKYERLQEIVGPERICGVLEDEAEQFDKAFELGLRPVFRLTQSNRAIHREPFRDDLQEAGVLLLAQVNEWREYHDANANAGSGRC